MIEQRKNTWRVSRVRMLVLSVSEFVSFACTNVLCAFFCFGVCVVLAPPRGGMHALEGLGSVVCMGVRMYVREATKKCFRWGSEGGQVADGSAPPRVEELFSRWQTQLAPIPHVWCAFALLIVPRSTTVVRARGCGARQQRRGTKPFPTALANITAQERPHATRGTFFTICGSSQTQRKKRATCVS